MKSYTDLEQSKKLAKILPIESADMYYEEVCNLPKVIVGNYILHNQCMEDKDYKKLSNPVLSPAWSLAALLDILPKHIKQNDGRIYKFHIFNDDGIVIKRWGCSYCAEDFHNRAEYLSDPHLKYPTNVYSDKYEDPVDACYDMVLRLHELNLL